mgnify:CR=1 FL=1
MFIHNKSIGKLFFLAVLCPILTFADVSWLYSGGQLIEQNVEEGARGWILNVSANGTGFLQFKGVAQSGTNVTGSVTSRRLLDMDAPITNASGVVYKINKLSDDIFNNSTIVDTIVLPSELTSIPRNFLRGDKSTLKRVIIPGDKITSISQFAFYENKSITNITPMVFNSLTYIGNGAFNCCENLAGDFIVNTKNLTLESGNYGTFQNCYKLSSFINKGDFTGTLPTRCFMGSGFKRIQITSKPVTKITRIEGASVYGCASLTNFSPLVFDRLTYIGKQAFDETQKLKGDFAITHENDVSIGTEAFGWEAVKMTSFSVQGRVTSIGTRFFQGDTALTNVYFGSTVASPGNYFLYGCTALRVLTMPYRPASFGGTASFDKISVRQMVVRADRRDTGVNGWFNPAKYTPWGELSQSVKNEWLNLSEETKKARGWSGFKHPKGVTLGLTKNQWLTIIPPKVSVLMLR